MTKEEMSEWLHCKEDATYFVTRYCMIYNATVRQWIPFRLWTAQQETLSVLAGGEHVIVLKARQLGLSWLTLCYILWQMIFYPAATVLIFSKRDEEAKELLSARLKGIHALLPTWMQRRVTGSNDHNWSLSNGSKAHAFPTTGGRSYTASIVLIDEGDFMPNLGQLMNAVQPTIDAGGQMIIISTVDKDQPESVFKRFYRSATRGEIDYHPIFLPWHARPNRTQNWYDKRSAESMAQNGTLDALYQEYPATEGEALAPNSLNKRFTPSWLIAVYEPLPPLLLGPAIPGFVVYRFPVRTHRYVIGADPAEGNPSSDDSAATVLDVDSGEEMARLRGKFEPEVLASHIDSISQFFNKAPAMVERNNHGHSVLLALLHTKRTRRLAGRDGRVGWLSSAVGKVTMYDALAERVRDNATSEDGYAFIHSEDTFLQLASIEGSTLKAPEGLMDDLADSFALAEVGRAAALIKAGNQEQTISIRS
jgi:hypothetical protein